MDPLSAVGLAANVSGLITLTIEVCYLLADYSIGIKNMSSSMKTLSEELTSLQHVLKELSAFLHSVNGAGKSFQKTSVLYLAIASCTGDVQEMAVRLKSSKNIVARTMEKLRWPFEEKEVIKFNDRLRKHISICQFSLTMETDKVATVLKIQKEHSIQLSEIFKGTSAMATVANQYSQTVDQITLILQMLSYLPNTFAEIENISLCMEGLQINARNEEEARILDWIPAGAPHKHDDISARRVVGTGEWLLHHETYRQWQNDASSNKQLWCFGGPGTGKTFLTSLVVDTLKEQSKSRNVGMAYFYCDYAVDTAPNFAATILKQLLMRLNSLPPAMLEFYELHRRAGFPRAQVEVIQLTEKLSLQLEAFFIVIDALDESNPHNQRQEILKVLASLRMSRIRVFVTSRPHDTEIKVAMQQASKIEAKAEQQDIRSYLHERLDGTPRLSTLIDENLRKQIIAYISEGAHGTFLLAVLQVQLVLNQVTRSGVRKALQQIPTELDQLFRDTLFRIRQQSPEMQEISLYTLMWLSCARRPLSISELQHAVATRFNEPQIDPDEDCPSSDIILESCLGLVTIEHDESTIRLCHFSLQEYLESQRENLFPQAQTTIARVCLTYLSYELPGHALMEKDVKLLNVSVEVILDYLPFLRYAAEHWGYHAKAAVFNAIEGVALTFAKDVLNSVRAARILANYAPYSRRSHESVLSRYNCADMRLEEIEKNPREFQCGLHLAARFDLPELIECLLEHGLNVNSVDLFDNCNTALHVAASRGHLLSVNTLLNHNASLNQLNSTFASPLFLAVGSAKLKVAKVLVQQKALVNIPCTDNWTALHRAVDSGQQELVRFLVCNGASLRSRTQRGLYPLHRASGRGHYEIIKFLLRRGAVVDATTEDGWTALHGAARSGQLEVVKILLEHNSDPNYPNIEYRTPLHHACRGGNLEIVKLLLSHGANYLKRDSHGQIPVHRAVKGDHPFILQLLLNLDLTQLSQLDRYSASPLDVAVSAGSFQAGKLLKGIIRPRLDLLGDTKTELEIAIEKNDAEAIRALISQGANVNAKEHWGWSALQQALQADQEDIGLILLQAGADVEATGAQKWRAIHVAARRGKPNAVRLCLEYHADINAVTAQRQTALHLACCSGDEETVRLLIESGCDIEAADSRNARPTHVAASDGHEGALRILLEKGADLWARAAEFRSIHACAARGCHYALVEFLRERAFAPEEGTDMITSYIRFMHSGSLLIQ